jgi:hypothetical protein
LRDVVERFTAEDPAIEVLEDVPQQAGLEEAVRESHAGFVVYARDDSISSPRLTEVLYRNPLVRILVIQRAERETYLCELRPHKRTLGELGPDGLIGVIRDDANPRSAF